MFEIILLRVFESVLKTSLAMIPFLIIILLLENKFRKQYSATWKYSLFLLILVRLLTPTYTVKEQNLIFDNRIPKMEITRYNILEKELNGTQIKKTITIPKTSPIKIQDFAYHQNIMEYFTMFAYIWLFIITAKLLYLIINYIVFYKKVVRWRTIPLQRNTVEIYHTVCNDMEIQKVPQIFVCHAIASPMCFGLFQKGIYITKENMTNQELEMILKHELCHYKRKDLIYQLLCILVSTMHFFNPFVTAFVKIAERDIELSCDDIVMENCQKDKRKQYSIMLLSMMNESKNNTLSNYFAKEGKFMKKRFENILDTSPKKKGTLLLISLGILYLLSFSCNMFAGAQQLILLFYLFNVFAVFSFCFLISTKGKKKKILFAMVALCLSVNVFIVGCSQNTETLEPEQNNTTETSENEQQYSDEKIERLLKWKTDYVGNNSAVGNILTELGAPIGMERNGFEIQSNTEPYGIKAYYNIENLSEVESKSDETTINSDIILDDDVEFQFYKNAIILFSLIGNLGYVEYDIFYKEEQKINIYITKEDIISYCGETVLNDIEYTDSTKYRYFLDYIDTIKEEVKK